ncbi:hypothetical protein [Delftia sp. PS-11]|uniref:hypothetical protein n=1 Tax=Delftia sp. PS-11 TaxID=2767222 RepID=UPI002455F5CE|nr:hypothetical protein [Delftia sp. PS-11]KAJ8745452.1 hypothetical protein H9T68_06545 [Delftia sp. PS-11]
MTRLNSAHVCTPCIDLDAMCNAAHTRLHQHILKAVSVAYIALGIDPPESHIIDVLLTLPGIDLATTGGL